MELSITLHTAHTSVIWLACRFALGSGGIYFGGKDIIISEVSGSWSLKAETGLVDRKGTKGARLSLQIGMPQKPPELRQTPFLIPQLWPYESLHTTPCPSSLKNNVCKESDPQQASLEQQPISAATEFCKVMAKCVIVRIVI